MTNDIAKCTEILEDINEEIISEIVYNNRRNCSNDKALNNFSTLWDCLSSASPRLAKTLEKPVLQDIGIDDIPELSTKTSAAVKETDSIFRQKSLTEKEIRKTVVEMQRVVSRLLTYMDSHKDC